MKLKLLTLSAFAMLMLSASPSFAGSHQVTAARCTLGSSKTTMVCKGTFAGTRALPDTSSYVSFETASFPSYRFAISLPNNLVYFCFAPAQMDQVWAAAMAAVGYFHVEFRTTTGECTFVEIRNGSQFKNASAL